MVGPGSASFVAPTPDLAFLVYHSWYNATTPDNQTYAERPASLTPVAFKTSLNGTLAPATLLANATFGVPLNATQDTLLLLRTV